MKKLIILLLIIFSPSAFATTFFDIYTDPSNPTVHFTYEGVDKSTKAGHIGIDHYYWDNDISDWALDSNITTAFCIDLSAPVKDGYADVLEPGNSGYHSEYAFGQAAWLFDSFWASQNSYKLNAALQLAIWDAIYDPNQFTVSTQTDTGIYKQYQDYMKQLGNNTYTGSGYRFVQFRDDISGYSGPHQELIVHVVPEPASMLLLGTGLLGLGYLGRRKLL